MSRIPFISCCFFACIFAMQACAQAITNWGEPIYGIQLSIDLSNKVIAAGSAITLQCLTTNTFTNTVHFYFRDSRAMYEASLIDNSRKVYEINDPTSIDFGMNTSAKIKPISSFPCNLPLKIDKSVAAGHYKFRVKQQIYFLSEHSGYTNLVSNLLDVQIK